MLLISPRCREYLRCTIFPIRFTSIAFINAVKRAGMIQYFHRFIALGAVFSLLASSLHAADIRLESADGAFALSGQLIDFDGAAYTLKSVFGEVRIEANEVLCTGEECPDLSAYNNNFKIASTYAIGEGLLPMLLEGFSETSGYQIRITDGPRVEMVNETGEFAAQIGIESGDASTSYSAIAEGAAMLTVASQSPDRLEVAAIADAGFGDISSVEQQTVLAMDGLVILVSQDNPVNSLSLQQVGEIFSGKTTNWNEIGGPDAEINVYRQNVDAGDFDFFADKILAPIGGEFTQAASILSYNGNISQSVDADSFGIGFSGYANRGDAKAVTLKGSCGIYSKPSDFSIKTEEYPLSRRLAVYVPDRTLPSVAQDLVDYLDTDGAQQVVSKAGYVSLDVSEISVEDQGLRFASAILSASGGVGLNNLRLMTEKLVDAKRLSTTFRFLDGSSTLDIRAQSDIQRLLDWLANADLANKEILMVGFTDSNGKLTVNMALAEQRAKQVLNALTTAAPEGALEGLHFETVGLGEVSPMVCNEAPNGRFVNRRVEVWIRDEI